MTTSRRTFLKGGLAATAATGLHAPAVLAQSAAVELKMHSFVPPNHVIWTDVLMPWGADVAKHSNNQLTIKFFPAMQLGGKPPELYRQAVQGIADIVFTLPGYTSADFPMMALTELPGTAKTAEEGTRKLWQNFDQFLARDFKGTKVLMLWNSDWASIMTKAKPVKTLEDMKGMKIRTPSAAQSAQLDALGATPIDMPAPAIYNNLDRGVIDASMIPMSAALDFKLIEVAKFYTIDAPLGRSPFLIAMNRAKYDGLAPNLKKVIDDTTGLSLSLKGADTYDKKCNEAIAAAKKDKEVITSLRRRSQALDRRLPAHDREDGRGGRKGGSAGRGLVNAYKLLG